jgi:4-hydroxybenzoate polyprenyltransferase
LNLAKLLHSVTIILLAQIGNFAEFGKLYWIGFSVFSALLIYQHTLVKHNDLSKVNLAFFTTNGIASVIFGTFVIADILLK